MSGKKLAYLIIIVSLTALTVSMVGCAHDEYEVEVQVEPKEAGEISGEGTYEKGEKVTVEAHGDSDYIFKGWMKEGEKISDEVEYTFEIEEDKQLIVEYIEYDEEIELINDSIENYMAAYLQGHLKEAEAYLESDKALESGSDREDLKDAITPTAIPAPAVDSIKPIIVESYLEDIKYQTKIIEIDETALVELELEYLDHEEFEELFDDKLKEALDKVVTEKIDWKDILTDAIEEAPRSSLNIELELTKEDDTWKLVENPIYQGMYPNELSDSIALAHNYVTNKEDIADKVEIVENSLRKAGFENYLPLSDSENHDQFIEDLDNVMRDMELTDEREGMYSPSIGTINLVEVANQIVELEEPVVTSDQIFNMDREGIQILYRDEQITTAGNILKEWNQYFDEQIDEEQRSLMEDFHRDRIRQGGYFGKQGSNDNVVGFDFVWGGCVNLDGAVGYIDLETSEIIISNFFSGYFGSRDEKLSQWSLCDNYHVYKVRCPGKGDAELNVTDLNDYTNIEIDQPEMWGNIQEATWSEDGNKLTFKEKRNGEEYEEEIIYWELNIPNREIVKSE